MATKTFIAVGGTGQHALLAYLHLMLIGGEKDPATCWIVDSDLMDTPKTPIHAINEFIEKNEDYGLKIRKKELNPKPEQLAGVTHFSSIFCLDPALDQPILDTFFESTQKDTDINIGFFGQPMVGAISIHQRLQDRWRAEILNLLA
jgi:hypothetical protein